MKKEYDIGIISYFFLPVNNPRSQRAFELAKEFSKRGYKTAVIIPDLNQKYDIKYNFDIIKVRPGYNKNKKEIIISQSNKLNIEPTISDSKNGIIKSIKNYVVNLLYPGAFNFEFSKTCAEDLISEKYYFKSIISIGLPICSHFAASNYYKQTSIKPNSMIADYGDPYSFNESINPPFIHRFFEKKMLKQFNYITVPIKQAVKSYTFFKQKSSIRVIPQGVDIESLAPKNKVQKNNSEEINFLYAGTFYDKIRDPYELINYLIKSNINYHFTILTDLNDPSTNRIISHLRLIEPSKITIENYRPRNEAIELMSTQDFLINIDNTTSNQLPSKLIDYKISSRPVFSYKPGYFSQTKFEKFLLNDFTDDYIKNLNLMDYEISNIVKKFEDLITKNT